MPNLEHFKNHEEYLKYYRDYRNKNREKSNKYQREYYHKPEREEQRIRTKKRLRIYHKTNEWKEYKTKFIKTAREKVVELLGNKCVKCGFDDKRALQIDHINGGGHKELREVNSYYGFSKIVLKSILDKEIKYQLLCANCNWIKRSENRELYKR